MRLRAWLVLITLSGIGAPPDGLRAALTRARTCELAAWFVTGVRPDVAFTLGLLDGIAQSLGVTGARLVEQLPPLADDLADALTGAGCPLRRVLDAVRGYELGDLDTVRACGLDDADLAEVYLAALAWTNRTSVEVT